VEALQLRLQLEVHKRPRVNPQHLQRELHVEAPRRADEEPVADEAETRLRQLRLAPHHVFPTANRT
jgi:hypothetical protein